MDKRTIAVNERGYRVGQDHQGAVLTDAEVELMREMREAGDWTYDALAEKFGVSKSAVAGICRYERRAQAATGWKEVRVSADEVGET
ncbi:helix-turn-helix domain-containing protein [Alcaligenaceae bacterium]|nr:helix-turn-helix domain-containing protein [Alcaligenaceae bacterium]